MEPEIDPGSSLPSELVVYSRHHKRKNFFNEGDDCSPTASSANAHDPLGMKLQKTSETSADRSEFGSVTDEIKNLRARKLHLLQLFSKASSPISSVDLNVERKRQVNQKRMSMSQPEFINLEAACPSDCVVGADIPVIILDSDEEDGRYQKHSHQHQKDALSGSAETDSDVKDCQEEEVKAPKEATSYPASDDLQVDKTARTDTKNGIKVKDDTKVKVSRVIGGGLLGNCNIQVDESAYSGMENGVHRGNSEKVKDSSDSVGGLLGKCNIWIDLCSYAGREKDLVIKAEKHRSGFEDKSFVEEETKNDKEIRDSEKRKVSRYAVGGSATKCNTQVDESAYAGTENHMVIKEDSHKIDVQDDGLAKINTDLNNLKDNRTQDHAVAAHTLVIILDSNEEDSGCQKHSNLYSRHALSGPVHELSMKDLTVKYCQEVKAPKDEAESSSANSFVQGDKGGYRDTENASQVGDSKNVTLSSDAVGLLLSECNIQMGESPFSGVESDFQVENSEKVEESWGVIGDLLAKCSILQDTSSHTSLGNGMVPKEEIQQIDVEDDAFVENKTEKDMEVGNSEKVKASRDAIGGSPTNSDMLLNNRVYTGKENHMLIEEDDHQIDAEDKGLAKVDTKDDFQDGDSKKVKASTDAVEGSLDKCNFQVNESAYAGMDNHMGRKEDNQEIEDHVLVETNNEDDIKDTKGKKVEALRDIVVGSPTKCSIQVDESEYTDMENDSVIEEDDHQIDFEDDGLTDIWKEMTFALECSKDSAVDPATYESIQEDGEDCDHSFVLKDDLGYVCRVCGVIERSIDTIFDFQYDKKRSTRTYAYEPRSTSGRESNDAILIEIKAPEPMVTEIAVDPAHKKKMKPHQVEGFNFLCSNLFGDSPGGCILAHAPGSGKTFLVISFIQSFLAKYSNARPLVVLHKGLLATWKEEFQKWQMENIPLHDFYTSKAENRSQQLDVLKRWVKERSILFLGYKQFSVIVGDDSSNKVTAECRDILLKVPTILILDEGHTPRNEKTDIVLSLSRVQTTRKVVLSGTLYQNHVKEVFNILNLVRPNFLKLKASRMIVNRIMGRGPISKVRKHVKRDADSTFFQLVEHTLQNEDFKSKKAVIQDLREMTSEVLHYYKGDPDELPGLVDFTVVLNLSARQKNEVQKLRKLDKFKRISVGSCVYMHPELKNFSEEHFSTGEKVSNVSDEKIDALVENLDVREGVKMKFFLNILRLCESAGEKLLVFSQFILPLKLLERLLAKVKGWSPGKEIFTITGDSTNEQREWYKEHFNSSLKAKVLFASIKACGEGISLVGASRILILDVHLNPSVTRQAIGRAFRPGQKKKVYTYRLVAADSPEQDDYLTCSRKEVISKMWFDWNESCGEQDFEVRTIDVNKCGDMFFDSPLLREDLNVLYIR